MLPKGKNDLAAFQFQITGKPHTLQLTEASTTRRAGLWCFTNVEGAKSLDRGGIDVLNSDLSRIVEELKRSNNTLKRALADPHRFDGIGNAYSDEILHAAKLSPLQRTQNLQHDELIRLAEAMRTTLKVLIERLQSQEGRSSSGARYCISLFEEMAVHGKLVKTVPFAMHLFTNSIRLKRVQTTVRVAKRRPHPGRPLAQSTAEGRLAAFIWTSWMTRKGSSRLFTMLFFSSHLLVGVTLCSCEFSPALRLLLLLLRVDEPLALTIAMQRLQPQQSSITVIGEAQVSAPPDL